MTEYDGSLEDWVRYGSPFPKETVRLAHPDSVTNTAHMLCRNGQTMEWDIRWHQRVHKNSGYFLLFVATPYGLSIDHAASATKTKYSRLYLWTSAASQDDDNNNTQQHKIIAKPEWGYLGATYQNNAAELELEIRRIYKLVHKPTSYTLTEIGRQKLKRALRLIHEALISDIS